MIKRVLIFAFAGGLLGCQNKDYPNEANFSSAIERHLSANGKVCVVFHKWPVDVTPMDSLIDKFKGDRPGVAKRMAALERAGLVQREEFEMRAIGIDGRPTGVNQIVKRYSLTRSGKKFERQIQVEGSLGQKQKVSRSGLCWGEKVLDRVVKWEGPIELGAYQEASVYFHSKIENIAHWAQQEEIQAAFPKIRQEIEGAGAQIQHKTLKLTSLGWEVK